jgi:hypothetical protein
MTLSARTRWLLVASTGAVVAAVGSYFLRVGLDRSNQVSGIIGAFVGIIGLSLSVYSIIQSRRSSGQPRPTIRMSQRSGNNSTNIQAGGDLRIGDRNKIGE